MAMFKCKMCGGDLALTEGSPIAQCEYCGSVQTVPSLDSEKKLTLFSRANRLRLGCEFDKAAGVYEALVADFPEEAEAYWGLVLCKYGIEYVDDPATGKKIPTCHRSSFESVMEDRDFEQVLENSDAVARKVYREEAKQIEEIRKGIISVSSNEQPYDIFICYKETDEKGNRTLDSVLAQDVYDALVAKDYRVFFSRITLEDKLGVEYEPYIFAALNSAKIMLAFGTDYEYFNAVWVKNEWSRFLKLMEKDKEKHLIPCYKGIDAYDLPKEFAKLQAQDLGKVGATQDLLRGIEKLLPRQEKAKETVVVQQTGNANTAPLLKRAFMFLEDGDWNSANEYCEKVLDIDPECAEAYLGKLMAELRCKKQDDLKDCPKPFDGSNNYQKAVRFGDDNLKTTLTAYIEHINTRIKNSRLEEAYNAALKLLNTAKTENDCYLAADKFKMISGYKDADALSLQCTEKVEQIRKEAIYQQGKRPIEENSGLIKKYEAAIAEFQKIPGYKDADELIIVCQQRIQELKAEEEQEQIEAEHRAKRNQKIVIIAMLAVCAVIAFISILNDIIIPNSRYNNAIALMDGGKHVEAISAFQAMNGYKDSAEKIRVCNIAIADGKYIDAVTLMEAGNYEAALAIFTELGEYKNSTQKITEIKYNQATVLKESGNYKAAMIAFGALGDYKDSAEKSKMLWNEFAIRETISSNIDLTVGLKNDGTVVAVGDNRTGELNVSDWEDVVAISAGGGHTVGLKSDGTVVAVGRNDEGQLNVGDWKDIVAISAGFCTTVGLKSDGTVVAVGGNDEGQLNVGDWKDIVAISAGCGYTVGLKSDGTVVAVGNNNNGELNVSDWKDIVAISADFHTVGLKSDGTVVAVGGNDEGQLNVGDWKDIVAISAGDITLGLKSDKTVVAVGPNHCGQCNVGDWTNIKTD